ncbi:hypothetical protein ACFY2Q_20160 [Micromonospora sp. NPDC000316]|uniref:hypothetical protein n=1 Tax=Micromonospora sp. NPDC000316 TaxID=3364216 RepID=UPI0036A4B99F
MSEEQSPQYQDVGNSVEGPAEWDENSSVETPMPYSPQHFDTVLSRDRQLFFQLTTANENIGAQFPTPLTAATLQVNASPAQWLYAQAQPDRSTIERLTVDALSAGGSGGALTFLESVGGQGSETYLYLRQVEGTSQSMRTSDHLATSRRLLEGDRDVTANRQMEHVIHALSDNTRSVPAAAQTARTRSVRMTSRREINRETPWVRELDRQHSRHIRLEQQSRAQAASLAPSSSVPAQAPAPAERPRNGGQAQNNGRGRQRR